MNHKLTPEEH